MAKTKRGWWAKRRNAQTQTESLAERADNVSERYFFRRLERLTAVRRFVAGWLLLIVLLCACLVGQIRALDKHFQTLQPTSGGVYTEGVVGDFTNANPLYANTQVDESVSRLLFSGLFKYDDNNRLTGDLASSYEIDATSKMYTVHLKPGLVWQDGQPLTAEDVAYTYAIIQNPDAQSVLYNSWQGINVKAVDNQTVTFTLPSILASFPYSLTNGIIPKHILKNVEPAEMRSTSFNTNQPIGAGPFAWQTVEVSGDSPQTREAQVALLPFKKYNGGAPKLSSFVIHAYHDNDQMVRSFKYQELSAANVTDPNNELLTAKGVVDNSFMLSAANMVFFRQGSSVLSDAAVRRSLVQSVNTSAIVNSLGYPTYPVREPFLIGQLGYDKTREQAGFDAAAAQTSLDAAGWRLDDSGVRTKGGVALRFTLYGLDSPESRLVTNQLVSSWKAIGVQADVTLQKSDDLGRSIGNRQYDALLYGISIGVDPDVFVYWHSSQNDARSAGLNFSEYNSKVADTALEAGRTRVEPDLRSVKYAPFLQAWQQDAPALGLYQPRYEYLTHGKVFGLNPHELNAHTDRYNNVNNWQIRQVEATNKP